MVQIIDLLVKGGQASGGPALGQALGPTGIKVNEVIDAINQKTSDLAGIDVPVKVHVDSENKTFEISVGTPPTSALLKKELGLEKASQKPGSEYVADIPIDNIIKVARIKVDGLLAEDMTAAVKEVVGTCQSLGVKVEGMVPKEAMASINEGKWADKISGKVELEKHTAEELVEKQKELQAEIEASRAIEKAEAEAEKAEAEAEKSEEDEEVPKEEESTGEEKTAEETKAKGD